MGPRVLKRSVLTATSNTSHHSQATAKQRMALSDQVTVTRTILDGTDGDTGHPPPPVRLGRALEGVGQVWSPAAPSPTPHPLCPLALCPVTHS